MAKQVNSAWAAIQNGSFDRLDEGLCVLDKAHKLIAWNDVFRQLLKLPRNLLKRGARLERLVAYAVNRGDFDHDQGERLIASWTRKTTKPGKKVAGWPREGARPLTAMLRRADDGQTLIIVKGPPKKGEEDTDWEGEPARQIAALDIHERKRTEDALSRQAAVLDQISEGVLIADEAGRITDCNPSACRIFGYAKDTLIGMNAHGLVTPEVEETALSDTIESDVMADQAWFGETDVQRSDGTTLRINASVLPRRDASGAIIGRIGVVRDITESRDAEEALLQAQKMESLGQLTGGIAHDFNNLLGVISGNLELLRDQTEKDDSRHSFIDTGLRSVRRGAELTQRLLTFARKQPLRPEVTDLSALVREMKAMLQRTLGERIQVKTGLADKAWPTLLDQGQMENVLLNLAVNARDSMPKGGTLLIKTENVALQDEVANEDAAISSGDYLKVTVKDTGTGMTPDILAKVFDPFFTTKGAGSGSGLGLSMVYGFVTQSSGYIRIDSTLGKGTAVELYLPRTFADIPVKTQYDHSAPPRGNHEAVLVVEDDDDLRELTVLLLDRMGYKTYQAADGHSAVALMSKIDHLDLLFTDVVLPHGLSGIDAARAAKDLFPAIKLLFTSGYTESEVLGKELEKSDVELITKPYRTDVLARRLQEVLED